MNVEGSETMDVEARVAEAASAVRARTGDLEPVVGLVLGSGLGSLCDEFEEAVTVPYEDLFTWDIPDYVDDDDRYQAVCRP